MLVCALRRGAVGCLRCGWLVVVGFLVVSAVGFGWFWFYLVVGWLCLLTCACFLSLGSLRPVCFWGFGGLCGWHFVGGFGSYLGCGGFVAFCL